VTGVDELRHVQVVSATPEAIRVSVLGGRTQLDVALPADVPVAAFLPELARLVASRDTRRDENVTDRDERRTFWVLSRVDGGAALAPDQTLRIAGVKNGELLRISAQRALSPPTLYDDVVDAAARLNRASYAAWDATAAGVMAFAGLWLCTAVWVYFLVSDALSAHRGVVIAGAVLTTVSMVAGGALVHRVFGRTDIATAVGWPAIALSAALGWALAAGYGEYGLAAACGVLLALTAVYYRVIGTGHWAYVGAAVVFGFGALVFLGRGLGGRVDVLAVIVATTAVLACLAVPSLTKRLARFPTPTVSSAAARKDRPFDAPFTPAAESGSDAAMPTAEEVWARVRWAVLLRAGLLAGLASVVLIAAAALLRARIELSSFVFALVCAAVLGLRSRQAHTVVERAALGAPATVLVLTASVLAQAGVGWLPLAGIGVLAAVAALAMLAGVFSSGGRLPKWVSAAAAHLDYAAVAALIPLALWPLGVYDRLGPW
jgi:type VII secretion integral membrane protein EccD